MFIALIGTAPSSIGLAPYDNPSWRIWACSPGAYYQVPRSDVWFEIHRWEPPVIGNPAKQKPWFSPEYVEWLRRHPCVMMFDPPAEIPNAKPIPQAALRRKYGDYFFTSSLSWMFAMAIEQIQLARAHGSDERDMIGLWGVDMAALEEYGYQRSGCQFFAQLAQQIGIEVYTPPESDLLTPPALYGLHESTHRGIKFRARMTEFETQIGQLEQQKKAIEERLMFLRGARDDHQYHMNNWLFDGEPVAADFDAIFSEPKAAEIPVPMEAQTPADEEHVNPDAEAMTVFDLPESDATEDWKEFTFAESGPIGLTDDNPNE